MKTKEIEGVVSGWRNGEIFVAVRDGQHFVSRGDKVTIECKVPEKKIEITESRFDEIVQDLEGDLCLVNHKQLKYKLFGEEK